MTDVIDWLSTQEGETWARKHFSPIYLPLMCGDEWEPLYNIKDDHPQSTSDCWLCIDMTADPSWSTYRWQEGDPCL